jgi:signal transduction histidine kinase
MANGFKQLSKHPHWRGVYDKEILGDKKRVHNFYGVPLKVANQGIVGVLKVENKRSGGKYKSFTDEDAHLFDILATHIAIAVANARSVEKIERQQTQLQTITNALQQVVSSLSEELPMQHLLEEIVETTAKVLSAEACVLFLKDEGRDVLVERAGVGYVAHLIGKAEYHLIPRKELVENPLTEKEKVGLTAWIAITGQPFLARNNDDLREHPHWRGRYDSEHYQEGSGKQCNSFLGLPLRVGEEILGVLKVENKQDDGQYVPFDERDQQLFQVLANSAAIAIRNTRDFQELRETQQLASIGRSAAAMAHRMRTPLQDIRTTAELLKEDLEKRKNGTAENLNDLIDIIQAVEQTDDAIERVRIAAKQIQPILENWDINDIICNGFTGNRSFAQQFQERNIVAKIEGLEALKDCTIQCDKNLIEEAISNLVTNALEAIHDGGRITIKVTEVGNEFHIEVHDDGPGIDKKRLNLFEPFNTTKKDGLGLGLFIVKRNIETHGGAVSFIPKDKGACFRIELPRSK